MQVFHRSTNSIARASIVGGALLAGAVLVALYFLVRSDWLTGVGVYVDQPVPFSHKHHVADDGIDCRYCHTTVETAAFAGMPPTQTCMNCHTQIWAQAPTLAPVRASYANNQPIAWNRVYNLPGFVYFDHSIHVNKGVGCATCHGQIDQMPLTTKAVSLQMEWCLSCHRDPSKYIRPVDQVFNMSYQPPSDPNFGQKLMQENHVDTRNLLDCFTCHR